MNNLITCLLTPRGVFRRIHEYWDYPLDAELKRGKHAISITSADPKGERMGAKIDLLRATLIGAVRTGELTIRRPSPEETSEFTDVDLDWPKHYNYLRNTYPTGRKETIYTSGKIEVETTSFDGDTANDYKKLWYKIEPNGYVEGYIVDQNDNRISLSGDILQQEVRLELPGGNTVIHDCPFISFQDVNGLVISPKAHQEKTSPFADGYLLCEHYKHLIGSSLFNLFEILSLVIPAHLNPGQTLIQQTFSSRQANGYWAELGGVNLLHDGFNDTLSVVDLIYGEEYSLPNIGARIGGSYLVLSKKDEEGKESESISIHIADPELPAIFKASFPPEENFQGVGYSDYSYRINRKRVITSGSITLLDPATSPPKSVTLQLEGHPIIDGTLKGHVVLLGTYQDKVLTIQHHPWLSAEQIFGALSPT